MVFLMFAVGLFAHAADPTTDNVRKTIASLKATVAQLQDQITALEAQLNAKLGGESASRRKEGNGSIRNRGAPAMRGNYAKRNSLQAAV
jgi:hypothetical protein